MTPESAGSGEVRIGTQEREQAINVLGEHLAAGRLEIHEYEERVGRATTARTPSELRLLFGDLPAPHPPALFPHPVVQPPPPMAVPPAGAPMAAYGTSEKSKLIAGLLQILLPFGVGRFYTGHTGMAVAQLVVTFVTFGFGALWPFIDGILLLVNGGTDSHGRRLRD
ncbi:DUF1707 domain-containing protein [Streptoalloteichus hindustanus]|uniref:TM2 domain-containing protein n=1 Tax=Streptoalloteichus hindustanus TaxID=2017 RepID=A0A1M5LJF7_STRHI|nr:DUF1707 domain-containing protein [Streptoalloteichus hindustanus]SHG64503.1 TM2 domain-containing protein [Streptoalloteichus hindustanus]